MGMATGGEHMTEYRNLELDGIQIVARIEGAMAASTAISVIRGSGSTVRFVVDPFECTFGARFTYQYNNYLSRAQRLFNRKVDIKSARWFDIFRLAVAQYYSLPKVTAITSKVNERITQMVSLVNKNKEKRKRFVLQLRMA